MVIVADEKLILKKGLTKNSVENIIRKLFLRDCSLKTKQTKTSTITNIVKQVFTSQRNIYELTHTLYWRV